MKILRPLPILAAALTLSACHPNGGLTDGEILLSQLSSSVGEGKVLFGQQDALMYGHSWVAEVGDGLDRSDIKDVCGHHPAVLGLDLGGIELAEPANLDGNPFDLMRQAAVAQYERGGIVTFSWHPRNPLTGGDAWDVSSKDVVASVLEGGECHGLFMTWLSRAADFMASLKTEDGEVIPVIFRPWHEHTGSWFWWGRDLCSVEEYVALWTMTYEYLTEERQMTNLVWSYSPGAGGDADMYMERYPGDDMVDMLGVDCYQYGSSEDYIAQMRETLEFMENIGSEHNKLIAVTETGVEGVPYENWWTGTLAPAIDGFPIAYVLVWRNAHDRENHFYGPWDGATSSDDFCDFVSDDKIGLIF